MNASTNAPDAPVTASPAAARLEFRDPSAAGPIFATAGVLGLALLGVGLYQILSYRSGPGFLFAHPDRLFEKGGIWALAGLALLLLFGVLPLLFGFETAVVVPERRVIVRRRGRWLRLPGRAVPFAMLDRAEVGEGNAKVGHGRRTFHFVRVVYRDGRSFRLPGVAGGRPEAEQIARTLNELLRPIA